MHIGASETEELYHVLTHCMMVRRLKRDVLSQLPPKRRTQVCLKRIRRDHLFLKACTRCQVCTVAEHAVNPSLSSR